MGGFGGGGGSGGPSGVSAHYKNGELPPEPAKSKWDYFNLPANAWVSVPISFIEIMIMVTPAAFLPDLLLDHFDGSYPVSAISTGIADSFGGILAFILSPTFGKWADLYGRKSVIVLLSVFNFLPIVCLTLFPYLNLWYYLSFRCFTKISALGILFCCVSDVAPIEQRGKLFSQTTGIGMSAVIIGPLLALLLNATWAFRVCGMLALMVLLYVIFLLPETLWIGLRRMMEAKEKQQLEAEQNAMIATHISVTGEQSMGSVVHENDESNLKTALLSAEHSSSSSSDNLAPPPSIYHNPQHDADTSIVRSLSFSTAVEGGPAPTLNQIDPEAASVVNGTAPATSPSQKPPSMNPFKALKAAFISPKLRIIALIILFSMIAQNGIIECALLYLKYHLNFTKHDNSLLLLGMGSWSCIVMIVIQPLLLRWKDDHFALALALCMDFCHQMCYFFLPDKKYFFFISFFQGLSFMNFPASNTILANMVSEAEQGTILSLSSGIRSLTQGMAPVLFNGLFSYFTWDKAIFQFSGAPFVISSTCILIALLLTRKLPRSEKSLRKEREALEKVYIQPGTGLTREVTIDDVPESHRLPQPVGEVGQLNSAQA